MPQPQVSPESTTELSAQMADYQQLLDATLALLGNTLDEAGCARYVSARSDTLQRTARRDAVIAEQLQNGRLSEASVADYRTLLEAVVAAETRLVAEAEQSQKALAEQLLKTRSESQTLSGYRSSGATSTPRAISQRA